MQTSNLHRRLKQETQEIHTRLEHNPLLADLMSPHLSRFTYGLILRKKHRFYAEIEPLLDRSLSGRIEYHPKLSWLNRDLLSLGLTPWDTPVLGIEIDHFEAALGALYVIEGSTLGSQLIVRQLKRSLPDLPHIFFSGYAEATGQRWRQFLRFLAMIEPDVADTQVVVSAQKTFDLLDRWLYQEDTHACQTPSN